MNGQRLPALARAHLQGVLGGERGLSETRLAREEVELGQPGACFVTLTRGGRLRGCIGTLEAHRTLGADLLANAVNAAMRDPRFPPVSREELAELAIEVSILSPPRPFPYDSPEDLLARLQPGVHGVILSLGGRRATFLPQVWEQLPDPHQFLEHLCHKAGLGGGCWRQGVTIQVYTVEKFHEV